MPIIENQDQPIALFVAQQAFTATAEGEILGGFDTQVNQSFSTSATLFGAIDGDCQPSQTFTVTVNGAKIGDPDTFGNFQADQSFTAAVLGDLSVRGVINIAQSFTAAIDAEHIPPETFDLNFTIDLIPHGAPPQAQRYTERLTIDATEVKIRSWVYDEPQGANFGTLEVELADITQKSLITSTSAVKFEIGIWNFGTSIFEYTTIFEGGEAIRTDERFGRAAGPDTFTFIGTPPMQEKLRSAPLVNTIVYDPAKHDLTGADFPVILDTEGNQYITDLVPISDMTLADLLEWVFEDKAGYSSVETNIPDFPVSRADFAAGRPYMEEVRGIIGVFEPQFSEIKEGVNDILWITDGTAGHPSGFPAPRNIGVSSLVDLGFASDIERIDAFLMTYQEDRGRYDYFTDRTPAAATLRSGWDGDFIETTVEETYRDYYINSRPFTPIRSELISVTRTSRYNGVTIINRSTETTRYNRFGNLTQRRLEIESRLPDPANDFNFGLITAKTVDEFVRYLPHPFKARAQYAYNREVREEAYVVTDGENQQLGEDYSRDLLNAYRAGNVIATMAGSFGPVRTIEEKVTAIKRETVKVRITETDYLAGVYVEDYEEERAADVTSSALVAEQKEMFVPGFEDGGNLERINVGEVPLPIAIPLVERILENRQARPAVSSAGLPGIDLSLQRGNAVAVTDRAGSSRGNFIIEGRRFEGGETGHFTTLRVKERE